MKRFAVGSQTESSKSSWRVSRAAIRYLVGMSYNADPEIRKTATRGIALAARHHPKRVQEVVRRLIWAMNDESATNALTAPEVLEAIAEETPELLLPMVPDLTRLAADPGLHEGLSRYVENGFEPMSGKSWRVAQPFFERVLRLRRLRRI